MPLAACTLISTCYYVARQTSQAGKCLPHGVDIAAPHEVFYNLFGLGSCDTTVLGFIGWEEGVTSTQYLSCFEVNKQRKQISPLGQSFETQCAPSDLENLVLEAIKSDFIIRALGAVHINARNCNGWS